jgi:hypothetical protein
MNKNLLLFFLILVSFLDSTAQSTILKGFVTDAKTKEPLTYVTVSVSNTETYFTDDLGYFEFEVSGKTDSVIFSYLGYKELSLKQRLFKKDTLDIKLEPEGYMLQEFVVKAKRRVKEKDTIAIRIFRNVVKNKDENKPKAYDSYQYEEYSKTVASLYNISPKLSQRKILKPFRFVLENQDTTEYGVRYIPLILKETITEYYHTDKPSQDKAILKASKVSGIEQLRFSDLLDIVYDNTDMYGEQTIVSGKTFVLPFAKGGLALYNYYFVDSVKAADSIWTYQLAFVPKSKSDLLFLGRAWIQDSSYAIKKIEISIDKRSNLNFINDYMLKQTFVEEKNVGWFLQEEERSSNVAFTKRKKSKSIRIYRYLSKNDIKLNQPIIDTIFNPSNPTVVKDYRRRTDSFWVAERHDTLSTVENNVYFLIDSLKSTKFYKRISKVGSFFSSGHYRFNKVDLGNLYQLVSWNDVEGVRLRLNFRSNWRLSEWVNFKTYAAIGTKDKKFKFGVEVNSKLPDKKNKAHSIGISYKDDYQRFSLEPNALEYDHIVNTLLRRRNIPDLVYVRNASIYYARTWIPNFSTNLSFNYKKYITVPGKIEFVKTQADSTVVRHNSFDIFSPQLIISATPGAKFLQTGNRKIFLKGNLPRFTLSYTGSFKGFISDFSFHKLDLLIEEKLNSPIGRTLMQLQASKLFGSAPYPLLFIHPGNQSLLVQYKRFNMMNEAEFAADQQISFYLEHHFDGFFFNKIPLWKKLGLREVFFTKMAFSSLDKNKVTFSDLPHHIQGLNGFYAEIGFGIESIAKLLRVDFNWRLTQKNKPDTKRFRVTFTISPNF